MTNCQKEYMNLNTVSLGLINKQMTAELIYEKTKLMAKYKINAQYSFILGLPTEEKQDTFETIQFMHKIYNTHPLASFTVGGYLPYPGTHLYDLAIKNGFKEPENTYDWESVDRWRNTTKLPWVDNLLCLHTRIIFSILKEEKMPWIFKKWLELRLRKKWVYLKYDLKLLIFLKNFLDKKNYKIYSIKDNICLISQLTTKILRKMI